MTKSRPILFSAPMVRAILDGTKTQTRRVVKPQPIPWRATECDGAYEWRYSRTSAAVFGSIDGICTHCPYGAPGDSLWVKETWAAPYDSDGDIMADAAPVYRASSPDFQPYRRTGPFETYEVAGYTGWRPSIFMPRWASRLTLHITEVRVERLQEISEDDAWAEGVREDEVLSLPMSPGAAAAAYSALWDSINGKTHPWDSNPWVWVVEFEVMR